LSWRSFMQAQRRSTAARFSVALKLNGTSWKAFLAGGRRRPTLLTVRAATA
jgi:hypothetical protein